MPLTYGRESLQTTSKTQGDFNLQNRFSLEIDGASVTGGPQNFGGIESDSDVQEYKSGETTSTTRHRPGTKPRHRPVVLRLALTPEQSREVFHHIGKWVEEFAFTRHALKVLAARARIRSSIAGTQDKRAA